MTDLPRPTFRRGADEDLLKRLPSNERGEYQTRVIQERKELNDWAQRLEDLERRARRAAKDRGYNWCSRCAAKGVVRTREDEQREEPLLARTDTYALWECRCVQ